MQVPNDQIYANTPVKSHREISDCITKPEMKFTNLHHFYTKKLKIFFANVQRFIKKKKIMFYLVIVPLTVTTGFQMHVLLLCSKGEPQQQCTLLKTA